MALEENVVPSTATHWAQQSDRCKNPVLPEDTHANEVPPLRGLKSKPPMRRVQCRNLVGLTMSLWDIPQGPPEITKEESAGVGNRKFYRPSRGAQS